MAAAARPLDDDRGACKLIPLQFVVCPIALCVRLIIILCLTELRREERRKISRTAHDCHTSRRNPLLFIGFSLLWFVQEMWLECVCTFVLKSKVMRMKQTCRVFSSTIIGSSLRGCQCLSAPIGGDCVQLFSIFSPLQTIQQNNEHHTCSLCH